MSRNLGAKNPLRQVLQVSFFEQRLSTKVTIFIVLVGLLLSVAHADKEPHQDDDIIGPRRVTQLPELMVSAQFTPFFPALTFLFFAETRKWTN